MDIEFHYYMTYLIAARAGFSPGEAAIVAQSAQEVDDNHIPFRVIKIKRDRDDVVELKFDGDAAPNYFLVKPLQRAK